MKIVKKQSLNTKQKQEILDLWNGEYPKSLSLKDMAAFDRYLLSLADRHHLLLLDDEQLVKGWLVHFVRDGERCFAMLLSPDQQGKGLGSLLLSRAKEDNTELNGWVIDNDDQPKQNGSSYRSPIAFYRKNGFTVLPGVRIEKNGISGVKVTWKSSP